MSESNTTHDSWHRRMLEHRGALFAILTTLAISVGGIGEMFDHTTQKAPLRRNIDAEEVGKAAVYLLSDLSSGTTGENLYVDSGFNIVGL